MRWPFWEHISKGKYLNHDTIICKLSRSKTNADGTREEFRYIPALPNAGILCPWRIWSLYGDTLPRVQGSWGPFVNMRSKRGRLQPFNTATIVEGWKRAARNCQIRSDFSGHSNRRARITLMLDSGISQNDINTIMGYQPNSKMPLRYDVKKRHQAINETAVLKSYLDDL